MNFSPRSRGTRHLLSRERWQLSRRKVAKNFGQWSFLSAREDEHGRFRAFVADRFRIKMQNGRSLPKISDFRFPSGDSRFTTADVGESQRRTRYIGPARHTNLFKCTPIWDELG